MGAVNTALACAALATATGMVLARVPGPDRAALLDRAKSAFEAAGPSPANSLTAFQADAPAQPWRAAASGSELRLEPDRYGQFHAEMEVEGRRVPVLVDTGASYVSLASETAAALGFYPAPADFTLAMTTANGVTRVAPVEIAELHVGPLMARHVKAMVLPHGALTTQTLLGMSFLRELAGFSTDGGRLVLRQ